MNAPFRLVDTPEPVRLRVDDFLLLADHGAFDDYAKTELIDGVIYYMNAQHSRHARTKSRLLVALSLDLLARRSELEAISEVTVRVSEDSAPEPDIVLTRFRGDREVPADTVALVVEVAESTLDRDLGRKAAIYAAAGIPEYWVVDLEAGQIIVQHQPRDDQYEQRGEVRLGQPLISATLAGIEINTAELIR